MNRVFSVQPYGSFVLATSPSHARRRAAGIAGDGARASALTVAEAQDKPVHVFRSGDVRAEVAWLPERSEFAACVTHAGSRSYVDVEYQGKETREARPRPMTEAELEEAARVAIKTLVDADDLDEGALLWERASVFGGEDRIQVRRSR